MGKSFLRNITWILIIGVFLVSILPNIFSNHWFLDVFSNFKLQYFILSIFLLMFSFLVLKKKVAALILMTLSILWNAYYIIPYYLNSTDSGLKNQINFKIVSINLLSSNTRVDLVKNYISREDPDVLVLMEFTPKWKDELLPILENYGYKELVAREDNFGIALLSKFKMKSSIDYFDLHNKPSILGNLEIKNKSYSILATHPVPPISQKTFEERNIQFSNIINKRSQFSDNLIIVGDFNTSSFSNHFRTLIHGDLKDSRLGFGLLPTWPADFKILQTTLDHCLVSENLTVFHRSTGENIGSDHLPIEIVIGIN